MEEMRNTYCSEDIDIEGKKETGWEHVGWMHLAQDRDQWWDHAVTIMKLRVP
jgi:hypothetical protein